MKFGNSNIPETLFNLAVGAIAGLAGAAIASPIQGIGNSIAFGDPYTFKNYLRDIGFGAVGGAVFGGATAYFKGKNIWMGGDIGNGRNAFSFNNSNKYSITAGKVEVIAFDDIASPSIEQIDLELNVGKQNLHYGSTQVEGRSYLTMDPKELTNQLNNGKFTNVGINHRGMSIVKFDQNIGNVLNLSGQNLGQTPYGVIHLNSAGQIHIVPWLPKK